MMFNNKLRFQFNINDSYVTQQRAWYAAYLNALLENPTRPIYDENGNYTEYKVNLKPYNPVAMINEEYDVEGYNQLMMSGKITLSPIEGLNRKHSKKCTFYTLRFGCSFAAVNTIKPQLL